VKKETKNKANRAYKYRLYPNAEQKIMFAKTFGCCRKVWNLMLSDKQEYYKENGTMLYVTPAKYKEDYPYLKEVDSLALCNVQLNLQTAYKNFFNDKKVGFPKYKSKHKSRKSYTTNNQNGTIAVFEDSVKLPKIGIVKAVIHRKVSEDWSLKSATISQEHDGSYYVSVLYECEENIQTKSYDLESKVLGLDYKSDGLYMDSNGTCASMDKYFRKSQKKLARAQRKQSRKILGSNNYHKQKEKVAKIYRHSANQRKDYLQKKSTEIANSYNFVCVESLDMKALSNKGFGNGKATMDNGYDMFLAMLDYKLHERGGLLVKIDKWYPSTQTCSQCGNRMRLKTTERTYRCDKCGLIIDRDYNAAINIKREGIRLLMEA
jgi:putative transposase